VKTPIEMLNAIIKMQEKNYGDGMNTHMELSTLVKEAKEVVKNCSMPNVVGQSGQLPLDFVKWYSGMEEKKDIESV
jgi:hypothetical protein